MSDTEIQTPEQENEDGLIAYMFTNDKDIVPYYQQLLDMYYRGVFDNAVGLMQAKHRETGELVTLLVGVEHDENGNTSTYPLARVLDQDEAAEYIGPDGEGNWLDDEEGDELFV